MLTGALLCLVALAPAADCPHRSTYGVPAHSNDFGPLACSPALELRGLPVKIPAPPCYAKSILVPAFPSCRDTPGSGTECVPAGAVPLTLVRRVCAVTDLGPITLRRCVEVQRKKVAWMLKFGQQDCE